MSLRLVDRTIALDPLNPDAYFLRGLCLFLLRRFEEAIGAFGKSAALAPQRERPRCWIGFCDTLLNRPAHAREALADVAVDNLSRQTVEAMLAARAGNRAGAYAQIAKMRVKWADDAGLQYAEIYAQLGDLDDSFMSLDKAVGVRDPGLQLLKPDPFLDPIRRDPRYAALLKRLKFP